MNQLTKLKIYRAFIIGWLVIAALMAILGSMGLGIMLFG